MYTVVVDFVRKKLRDGLVLDSGYAYISALASNAAGFLLSLVLTRVIDLADFGLAAIAVAVVTAVALFLDLRIEEAIIRFATEYRVQGELGRAWQVFRVGIGIDIALGVATFGLICLAAPVIALLYPEPEIVSRLIRIYALVPLFSTADGSISAVLVTFRRFDRVAVWQIGYSVFYLIWPPLLAYRLGVEGVLWGYWLARLMATGLLAAFSLWEIRLRFAGVKAASIRDRFWEMVVFCFHTSFSSAFKSVVGYVDVLILGALRPSQEVSYYKIGMSSARLLTLLVSPLKTVLLPVLSKLWAQHDKLQFARILRKFTLYAFGLSLPGTLLFFLLADWLVVLFYPQEYLPAATVIRIAIWGILLANIGAWARPAILSMGKPQLLTCLIGSAMILRLVGNLVLVPLWGYVGAAAVEVIVASVNVVGMYVIWRAATLSTRVPSEPCWHG